MGVFTLDIKGQLNSMRLADSKALWPLFEAVVNSIQAIEDSPNRDCGRIDIYAQREPHMQTEMDEKGILERFESFTITDNGIGLDDVNYRSFNTAYSTLKLKKGCKGIGRFLWLKAFDSVEIKSIFQQDGQYFKREFIFNPDGVSPEENVSPTDENDIKTTVTLKSFFASYRYAAPVELVVVAKKIIEHCLPFFISEKCPKIMIRDNTSISSTN